MVTLAWHELISWALTLVSGVLLFSELRKNNNTKYYMVLQGILRACSQRANFLAHLMGQLEKSDRAIPREEFLLSVKSEYANYVSLLEHIMGSMKSLQPHEDMPFDVEEFVRGRRPGHPDAPSDAQRRMET